MHDNRIQDDGFFSDIQLNAANTVCSFYCIRRCVSEAFLVAYVDQTGRLGSDE